MLDSNIIILSLVSIKWVEDPAKALPLLKQNLQLSAKLTGMLSEYNAPMPTGLLDSFE